jgi:hypothetical protein
MGNPQAAPAAFFVVPDRAVARAAGFGEGLAADFAPGRAAALAAAFALGRGAGLAPGAVLFEAFGRSPPPSFVTAA